jgi:hypothetical protein
MGNDERIDDLVQRAQKLLKGNETENSSKALALRGDSLPTGTERPRPPVPVRRIEAPRNVEVYTAPPVQTFEPRRLSNGTVTRTNLPPIELPRYCTVFNGEVWLARYVPRNGEYEFNTGIELKKHQQSRYSQENVITLPEGFQTDVECCACCGAWSRDGSTGAIWCARHNGGRGARVCWGRTTRNGFFTCCDSCGMSGQLKHYKGERVGFVPGRYGGSFGSL